MNILLTYTVINYFISSCLSVPTNLNSLQEDPIFTTNSSKNQENVVLQQIAELQQQKDDLFREINKAMEESVAALKNSNVTNAQQGVSYIEDLKIQIKNIANTNDKKEHDRDVYPDNGNVTTAYNEKNSELADARRNSDKQYKQHKNSKINNKTKTNTNTKTNTKINTQTNNSNINTKYTGRSKNDTLNIKALWTGKTEHWGGKAKRGDEKFLKNAEKELDRLLNAGLSGQRLKDRLKRRQKMKEQLEAWVRMRYEEQRKIKEYREKMSLLHGKLEACPRHGFGAPDKMAQLTHTTKANARYPCCRKCCKLSYLGCLK